MGFAPDENHSATDRTASRRLFRVLLRWPLLLLAALAAAVFFALAGSASAASAAPPAAGPESGSTPDQPTRWATVNMKIKGTTYKVWYNDALDPDDPHYKKKLAAQIVVRRLATRAAGGNIGVPSIKEIPDLLDDVAEYARRSRETVGGSRSRSSKSRTRSNG